jgi:hypothetical protein
LKSLADVIGVAAITKAYDWAESSVNYSLNTYISWGRTLSDRNEIQISLPEAAMVKSLIEDKSEVTEETVELDGVLLGHDGATEYFHLETLGERQDIRGRCARTLSRVWTTGRPYHARLLRETQIRYATGAETTSWLLLALEPLEEPHI